MIIRSCKTPSEERRLSTSGAKIAACKPNEKFFRLLGSSSLHVNSLWVYKQVFPLIKTGVLKLNKNGLKVRQLLCSLSFGLFETMVISNARNNPCPFSNLSNHFDIHSIFNICFTIGLIYFETDARQTNLLTLLTFLFLPFSDNHVCGFKFKTFFGIRDIIISEY